MPMIELGPRCRFVLAMYVQKKNLQRVREILRDNKRSFGEEETLKYDIYKLTFACNLRQAEVIRQLIEYLCL